MHDLLNLFGAPAIHWARLMLFQSTLLVALLLAVDWLLGRRLRSAVRYALWLLVLLKLLLPPSLLLPTGAGFWLGRWWAEPVHIPPASRMTIATRDVLTVPEPKPVPLLVPTAPASASLTPDARLLLLWLAGAAFLAAGLWMRNRPVRRIARDAVEAPDAIREPLRAAAEVLGLSRIPRLRVTTANHSPAVRGLFRPEILLPDRLADRLAPDALQLVLLHELAHLKRRDLWITWVQAVVQVVWWWNPAVWIANARIRALRETAVDDLVMAATRHDPSAYPSALLAVARHCAGRPMLALSLLGILEAGGSLRSRVNRLLHSPLPSHPHLGAAGWSFCVLAGLVLLPMGFQRRVEAAVSDTARGASIETASAHAHVSSAVGASPGETNGVLRGAPIPGVHSFVVTVRADEEGFFVADELLTADEVTAELRKLQREPEVTEIMVHLQVERGVNGNRLVPAVEVIRAAGFSKIFVSTGMPPAGELKPGDQWLVSTLDFQPLMTRTFRVNPNTFLIGIEAVMGNPLGLAGAVRTNGSPEVQSRVRDFFRAAGVDFPRAVTAPPGVADIPLPQKALFFNDRNGILFVRATAADLDVVEKAIQALNVAPPQVEVEARFMVLEDGQAGSLGLDFLLKASPESDASGTNAAVGLLTESQYRAARVALESRTGVQTLFVPKVITLGGRQAMASATAVIPVPDIQGRLQDIPFGPTLDVIPEVMSDDVAIQLTVTASFSELLALKSGASFPLRVRSGVFSASAALRDAQTLVLAGELVEGDGALKDAAATTAGDSQVLQWIRGPDWTSAGRQLLVFITPVLVDPAGRRLNDPPK
ncbi:MAG: hypothetical protein J0L84_07655 [Verrucomicrobia bacterium]|nr:hypothetical protein [Verrucomicrobiota bacterium]